MIWNHFLKIKINSNLFILKAKLIIIIKVYWLIKSSWIKFFIYNRLNVTYLDRVFKIIYRAGETVYRENDDN